MPGTVSARWGCSLFVSYVGLVFVVKPVPNDSQRDPREIIFQYVSEVDFLSVWDADSGHYRTFFVTSTLSKKGVPYCRIKYDFDVCIFHPFSYRGRLGTTFGNR